MKNEEYYFWENGYLNANNIDLLKVEVTVGPNNQVNSYDCARTVTRHRISSNNYRIFYISLGHSNSDFTSDTLFQKLLIEDTFWYLELNFGLTENQKSELEIFPVPVRDHICLKGQDLQGTYYLNNLAGKVVIEGEIDGQNSIDIDTSNLSQGLYFFICLNYNKKVVKKIILQ